MVGGAEDVCYLCHRKVSCRVGTMLKPNHRTVYLCKDCEKRKDVTFIPEEVNV